MDELVCPYCGKYCRPSEDCYEQDTDYEHECEHCGKYFSYFLQYYPYYTEKQAPCLNGEDHKYEPVLGFPEEYFKGKVRCLWCGDETTITS